MRRLRVRGLMQTSGLLIHVEERAPAAQLRAALEGRGDLELGPANGRAWPAVLEVASERASVDAVRELQRLDGVARVDVVFIGTDLEQSGDK